VSGITICYFTVSGEINRLTFVSGITICYFTVSGLINKYKMTAINESSKHLEVTIGLGLEPASRQAQGWGGVTTPQSVTRQV
jgi:hypothetical protein